MHFLSLFSPLFGGVFTGVSVLIECFFVPYFMTDFRALFSCLVLMVLQFDGSLLVLNLVFQGLGGFHVRFRGCFLYIVGPISWSISFSCRLVLVWFVFCGVL